MRNPSTRGVEGHHPYRPGNADHPSSLRFISLAALFVKVIARISFGFAPAVFRRWTMR